MTRYRFFALPTVLLANCVGDTKVIDTGSGPAGDTTSEAPDESGNPVQHDTDTDGRADSTDTDAPETGGEGDTGLEAIVSVPLTQTADNIDHYMHLDIFVTGSAEVTTAAIEGRISYEYYEAGVAICDAEIALASTTPYTGACDGCDYAFDMGATVVSDLSAPDCYLDPYWTYVEGYGFVDLIWALRTEYDASVGSYTEALLTGLSVDLSYGGGSDMIVGPYFQSMIEGAYWSDSSSVAGIVRTGSAVDWYYTWAWDTTAGFSNYAYGGEADVYPDGQAVAGSSPGYGSVDPYGYYQDVWSFSATSGTRYALSVDTVSAAEAFDPLFAVTDPTGDTIMVATRSFPCTWSVDWTVTLCPSGSFEATMTGEHEVHVMANSNCEHESCDYRLDVAAQGE